MMYYKIYESGPEVERVIYLRQALPIRSENDCRQIFGTDCSYRYIIHPSNVVAYNIHYCL